MASTKQSTTAIAFNMGQAVRRSSAMTVRQMNGVHFDRLVAHNDLVGTWPGADQTQAYCGIVPVVGGVERFDLAWLSFDLQTTEVASFPKGATNDVTWVALTDELHTFAVQSLATAPNYTAWLNGIVAHFPAGGTLVATQFDAKTKKGGIWHNAVLGANL